MEDILKKINIRECEKQNITDLKGIMSHYEDLADLIVSSGPTSLEEFEYLYEIFKDPIYTKNEVDKMGNLVFSTSSCHYPALDGADEVSNYFTDLLYNYISFEPGRELNYQEIELLCYGKTISRKKDQILSNINKKIKDGEMVGGASIGCEELDIFEVSTVFREEEYKKDFYNIAFFEDYKETFDELLKRRPELNIASRETYGVDLDEEIVRFEWGATEDYISLPDFNDIKVEYANVDMSRPINDNVINIFLDEIDRIDFGLADFTNYFPGPGIDRATFPEPEFLHDSLAGYKKFDFWKYVAPLTREEIKSKILHEFKNYQYNIKSDSFYKKIDFLNPDIETVYDVMDEIEVELPNTLHHDKKEWDKSENVLIYPKKFSAIKN